MQKFFRKVNAGIVFTACLLSLGYVDCHPLIALQLNELAQISPNSPTPRGTPTSIPKTPVNPKPQMNEDKDLKPAELKLSIEKYKKEYEGRFQRNQYTNNIIIGASIFLAIFIAITGTSPWFKEDQNKRLAYPLGVSAAAWLGLISTALLSIQKLYNISDKVNFYPPYIVKTEELLEDFNEIKNSDDLKDVKERFRKMRVDEAGNRPVEISPK